MPVWAGVDVGGRRKGFHVAALDDRRVVHAPSNVVFPTASWNAAARTARVCAAERLVARRASDA